MISQKDILIISIFSVMTVFIWIISDVYHAAATTQITPVQEKLIFPLNPAFDQQTIDIIRSRQP